MITPSLERVWIEFQWTREIALKQFANLIVVDRKSFVQNEMRKIGEQFKYTFIFRLM